MVATDLLWKFIENQRPRKKMLELNNLSTANLSAIIESEQREDRVPILRDLLSSTEDLYKRLKKLGYLTGHSHNLIKLQNDLRARINTDKSIPKEKPIRFRKPEDFPSLKASYDTEWHRKVRFEIVDCGKVTDGPYLDAKGQPFTHIYSYTKLMSKTDRREISKKLNRTNFRLLSWFFGPNESAKCGLKRVKLVNRMSMQSTGK